MLGAAFKTLEVLCKPQSSSYTRCYARKEQLVEVVVRQFRERLEEYNCFLVGELELDQDEIFGLELSLCKVSLLYNHHDLSTAGVWEMERRASWL